MSVDEQTVKQVASLARLDLTPKEVKQFQKELSEVLSHFKILEKVKTKNIEPAFHPLPIKNATRKDTVEPSLPRKKALANTKNKEDGYFTGPSVV